MKRMMTAAIASLVMMSCTNPTTEEQTNGSNSTKLNELDGYVSMAQNMEEPKTNDNRELLNGSIQGFAGKLGTRATTAGVDSTISEYYNSNAKTWVRISKEATPAEWLSLIAANPEKFRFSEYLTNFIDTEETGKVVSGVRQAELSATYNTTDLQNPKFEITGINNWSFIGKEVRTWGEVVLEDSVKGKVTYDDPQLSSLKPGKSTLWVKNLKNSDTTLIVVDSLDDIKHIQYGKGLFYQAVNKLEFNYNFEIIHKNSINPEEPYKRYQDNEAKLTYILPTPQLDKFDSLAVSIHYHYEGIRHNRHIEIRNAANDSLLVEATGNVEKIAKKLSTWSVKKYQ